MDSQDAFLADVLRGLTTSPRSIPGKYLWDEEGSRIFDAITRTANYYHTAAEQALTRKALPYIAALLGAGACVVEFGSGASRKTRQLLDALDGPALYVALDISGEFLESSTKQIATDYPNLDIRAMHADYSKPLPSLPINRECPILGFFPGTSIGNMMPNEAQQLLERFNKALTPGYLLIGRDTNRDPVRLQEAYEGPLMTALHKNILMRLTNELGAKLELDAFRHESRTFDSHVEPHLVAIRDTQIQIAGHAIEMRADDSIRTDLSWKYSAEDFASLATAAGWSVERGWSDCKQPFALTLLSSA